MKTDLFQSCGHCWVFQICWYIEYSTLIASSSRILNSLAGILSPPLALLVVMLPKAHLTSYSKMSGSRWVTPSLWLCQSLRPFLYSSSLYSCHLFLISSASVRSFLLSCPSLHEMFLWYIHFSQRDVWSFPFYCFFFFFYFFALFIEEGLISPCYCLELCIQLGVSFLFSLAFCYSSFLSYL